MDEARKLLAAGDVEGARAFVQRGIACGPQDSRLIELLAIVDRAIQSSQENSRAQTDQEQAQVLNECRSSLADLPTAESDLHPPCEDIAGCIGAVTAPAPEPIRPSVGVEAPIEVRTAILAPAISSIRKSLHDGEKILIPRPHR